MTTFQNPATEDLIKSVRALLGAEVDVFVGDTIDRLIPLPLSSRPGGKLKCLEKKVVMVGFGAASKNLSVLIFDQQEAVSRFLTANLVANRTLVTRALNGGLVFWFRCAEWTPGNITTSEFVWCSAGAIPLALAEENLDQRIVRRLPVAEIKFEDLRWDPEFEHVSWCAQQAFLYGPVWRKVGPRKKVLNANLICRVFVKDTGIIFDAVRQHFYQRDGSGNLEFLSPEALLRRFTAWLQRWSSQCESVFPTSELRLPRVQSLVQHLKLIAAAYEPDPWAGLLVYAKEQLQVKAGTDVTVQEIHADYISYAEHFHIGLYPPGRFRRQLPKAIQELFNVIRSNSLRRPNGNRMGWRRGFRGLTFRRDEKDAGDGKDGEVRKTP